MAKPGFLILGHIYWLHGWIEDILCYNIGGSFHLLVNTLCACLFIFHSILEILVASILSSINQWCILWMFGIFDLYNIYYPKSWWLATCAEPQNNFAIIMIDIQLSQNMKNICIKYINISQLYMVTKCCWWDQLLVATSGTVGTSGIESFLHWVCIAKNFVTSYSSDSHLKKRFF